MAAGLVEIPELHAGQVAAFDELCGSRFLAVRCGRRWGKTILGVTLACDAAAKGYLVGYFAPDYKILGEIYHDVYDTLQPIATQASQMAGVIRTRTGGRIDFWTTENERAGRSRKYHLVIMEEMAFSKPNMFDVWSKSIKPTLLDYGGKAIVLSNTNGSDPSNFMWRICNQPEHGFSDYHAPTRSNPYLPAEEVEKLKAENHPLVYAQEYEAQFVDWSGEAFFKLESLLVNEQAPEWPNICDYVYATVDTAIKTGKECDGTAVVFWAVNQMGFGIPLVALDWDIIQIEGALLDTWLPTVFQRLEEMAIKCKARHGSAGAWIEDKASGMVLLQQAQRHGWNAHAIDSKLTAVGKSERAISVSSYVHQNKVKISNIAYDRITNYKGVTRNHFVSQVVGFRVGVKDDGQQDDLLDAFTYGIAVALGNTEGF